MNFFTNLSLFLLFLGSLPLSSFGAETIVCNGDIELDPKVMHKNAIIGKFDLKELKGSLSSLELQLSTEVLGDTVYESTDLKLKTALTKDQKTQFGLYFSLDATPHSWTFLLLGSGIEDAKTSKTSITGTVYKIKASDAVELENNLKGEIQTPVSTWKKVGSFSLNPCEISSSW